MYEPIAANGSAAARADAAAEAASPHRSDEQELLRIAGRNLTIVGTFSGGKVPANRKPTSDVYRDLGLLRVLFVIFGTLPPELGCGPRVNSVVHVCYSAVVYLMLIYRFARNIAWTDRFYDAPLYLIHFVVIPVIMVQVTGPHALLRRVMASYRDFGEYLYPNWRTSDSAFRRLESFNAKSKLFMGKVTRLTATALFLFVLIPLFSVWSSRIRAMVTGEPNQENEAPFDEKAIELLGVAPYNALLLVSDVGVFCAPFAAFAIFTVIYIFLRAEVRLLILDYERRLRKALVEAHVSKEQLEAIAESKNEIGGQESREKADEDEEDETASGKADNPSAVDAAAAAAAAATASRVDSRLSSQSLPPLASPPLTGMQVGGEGSAEEIFESGLHYNARVMAIQLNQSMSREAYRLVGKALAWATMIVALGVTLQALLLLDSRGEKPPPQRHFTPGIASLSIALIVALINKHARQSSYLAKLYSGEMPLPANAEMQNGMAREQTSRDALLARSSTATQFGRSADEKANEESEVRSPVAHAQVELASPALKPRSSGPAVATVRPSAPDQPLPLAVSEDSVLRPSSESVPSGDVLKVSTLSVAASQRHASMKRRLESVATRRNLQLIENVAKERLHYMGRTALSLRTLLTFYSKIVGPTLLVTTLALLFSAFRLVVQFPPCSSPRLKARQFDTCPSAADWIARGESVLLATPVNILMLLVFFFNLLRANEQVVQLLRPLAFASGTVITLGVMVISGAVFLLEDRTDESLLLFRIIVGLGFVALTFVISFGFGRALGWAGAGVRLAVFTLLHVVGYFVLTLWMVDFYVDAETEDEKFVIVVIVHPIFHVVFNQITFLITTPIYSHKAVEHPFVFFVLPKMVFTLVGRFFITNLNGIGVQIVSVLLLAIVEIVRRTSRPTRSYALWSMLTCCTKGVAVGRMEVTRTSEQTAHDIYSGMASKLFGVIFSTGFTIIARLLGSESGLRWEQIGIVFALQIVFEVATDIICLFIEETYLDMDILAFAQKRYQSSFAFSFVFLSAALYTANLLNDTFFRSAIASFT